MKGLALERVTAMRNMGKRTIQMRTSACGLALALLMGTAGVAAAQESRGDWYDTKILRKILEEIGLRRDEKPIDYHERSPLVIPPTHNLPPPQRDAVLSRNPDWPKDPDVEQARAAKSARQKDTSFEDEGRVLRPDELNKKGPVRRRSETTASTDDSQYPEGPARLPPSKLGVKGTIFNMGSMFGHKKEAVPFKGEPPRTSLVDPPAGLLTPSPAEPYGLGKKQAKAKAIDIYTTRGEVQQ